MERLPSNQQHQDVIDNVCVIHGDLYQSVLRSNRGGKPGTHSGCHVYGRGRRLLPWKHLWRVPHVSSTKGGNPALLLVSICKFEEDLATDFNSKD